MFWGELSFTVVHCIVIFVNVVDLFGIEILIVATAADLFGITPLKVYALLCSSMIMSLTTTLKPLQGSIPPFISTMNGI